MDNLATLKDILTPIHDYIKKQVDYYQSMGLKNSVEIGKQAAYEDVLNKIKQFEFNGRI